MDTQLILRNLDECLATLNSRGDCPADLFLDYSSGDVWIPDYPKEHEYTCHFCGAIALVHEFPAKDDTVYTAKDIEAICQDAYRTFRMAV